MLKLDIRKVFAIPEATENVYRDKARLEIADITRLVEILIPYPYPLYMGNPGLYETNMGLRSAYQHDSFCNVMARVNHEI